MFKIGSFEEELASTMEKSLVSSQLENRYSFDKVSKAADYINAAAELLDDTGFSVEAAVLTKVLEKLANDNNSKHTELSDKEVEELLKDKSKVLDEVVIEPIDQEIEVEPRVHLDAHPGTVPLDIDYQTGQIFEPYLEYKSLAQVAQLITNKYAKKKV